MLTEARPVRMLGNLVLQIGEHFVHARLGVALHFLHVLESVVRWSWLFGFMVFICRVSSE